MKKLLYLVNNTVFQVSFLFYIIFIIIELIKPGFIVRFFYLNYFLIICLITAVFSVIFKHFTDENYIMRLRWIKIFLNLILGGLLFLILLNKGVISPAYDFWILIIALFSYVFAIMLFVFYKEH